MFSQHFKMYLKKKRKKGVDFGFDDIDWQVSFQTRLTQRLKLQHNISMHERLILPIKLTYNSEGFQLEKRHLSAQVI